MNHSNRFEFGSKAETLQRIKPHLMKSSVPAFHYFTVSEWRRGPDAILSRLQQSIDGNNVIIRSSTTSEDGALASHAGSYLSVPHISLGETEKVVDAIEQVIDSYPEGPDANDVSHQVLIQTMITDVSMSGVVFTQDMVTGGPYYVVNYDDKSGSTDTITSGTGYDNRTLYIHRSSWRELESDRFLALIEAIGEIERSVGTDRIDIEFALDNNGCIHVFQIRRITTHTRWPKKIGANVDKAIALLRPRIQTLLSAAPGRHGSINVLGKMPDWNPAEIIGSTPKPLARTLYEHLVTDRHWQTGRAQLGYSQSLNAPLMVSLEGQPYIDVRLCFHSLLPATLPTPIGDKLVNGWLKKLAAEPDLHDRVEFEIAVTSLTLDFEERVNLQFPGLLDETEKENFRQHLLSLTKGILVNSGTNIGQQYEKLAHLEERRLKTFRDKDIASTVRVRNYLSDCAKFGVLPFTVLSRHAFIAEDMLRGLVGAGILSETDAVSFRSSLSTVATDFITALEQVSAGQLSVLEFMEAFGHLRPGTYDICSPCYSAHPDFLESLPETTHRSEPKEAWAPSENHKQEIQKYLDEMGIPIFAEALFHYIADAIRAREYGKFIFTKSLSAALEAIADWGAELGLSRNDLSYLDIETILNCDSSAENSALTAFLETTVDAARAEYEIGSALRLPYVISRESDLVVIPLALGRPNYITNKHTQGKCVLVRGTETNVQRVDNRIVAIESADPGFDWIFSRPIKGLITKFGGVNSHMAIRCAEFELPAAIGCGEQIFNRVVQASTIDLNCADGRVQPIEG